MVCVCVRGAVRRAEAANRALHRIVAQHFSKRSATMRSNARLAVSARRNPPRTYTPCAHHFMARAW
eukprot:3383882-Lingulodinium_polyedra.AAC.1